MATPVNESEFGVPVIHPACTVKDTLSDSVTLLDALLKVMVVE